MGEATGIVYRVRDLLNDSVVYVGQTGGTLNERRTKHWSSIRSGRKAPMIEFLRSRADRRETLVFEEVEVAPLGVLHEREAYWTTMYRDSGEPLLNVNTGGRVATTRPAVYDLSDGYTPSDRAINRGEDAYNAKLTWDIVRKMREIRAMVWVSQDELAATYGVSQGTIQSILANKSWYDAGYDPRTLAPKLAKVHANNRQVSEETVREIRELRKREWVPEPELARRYGLTRSNVHNILSGHRWPDPDWDPSMMVRAGGDGQGSTLTADDVREIKLLLRDKVPQAQIGARFGVTQGQVSRIARGLQWKDVVV